MISAFNQVRDHQNAKTVHISDSLLQFQMRTRPSPEIAAVSKHTLADRPGDWRVSIIGSQANDVGSVERLDKRATPSSTREAHPDMSRRRRGFSASSPLESADTSRAGFRRVHPRPVTPGGATAGATGRSEE